MTALYREFLLVSPAAWAALAAFVKVNAKAFMERNQPLRVIVTADEKKRNVEQNKRLWGYLYANIAEQAWVNGRQFDKDTWHEFFARQFGVCDEMILPSGEIITTRKSTTRMTVGEFAEFMQQIEAYAASELGVIFP
jgi:hypothetical protein